MSACSVGILLDEKCNNPRCNNRLMPGTGLRFASQGMEYAFCGTACASIKITSMLEDVKVAIANYDRMDTAWRK